MFVKNSKVILIGFFTLVLIISLIVVGLLLNHSGVNETDLGEFFTFPISVGEKTFQVSVLSNYSSSPSVSYWEEGKVVYLVFTGNKENSFFNVTIPTDLIWGELTLIDKYYKVDEQHYIQSYNGTHNSMFFSFDHQRFFLL